MPKYNEIETGMKMSSAPITPSGAKSAQSENGGHQSLIVTNNLKGLTFQYDLTPLAEFFTKEHPFEDYLKDLHDSEMRMIDLAADNGKTYDFVDLSNAIWPIEHLRSFIQKIIDNKVMMEG